jgi:hypothetical protein
MSMPEIAFDPPVPEYRAGACNIGPAEIAARRRSGYVGLAAAVGLAVALVAVDAPSVARLLVALPLAGGAAGFLQARFRFCAAYGFAGQRSLRALGAAERVEDAADRRADRRRALAISAASLAIGVAGAAAFVALPI